MFSLLYIYPSSLQKLSYHLKVSYHFKIQNFYCLKYFLKHNFKVSKFHCHSNIIIYLIFSVTAKFSRGIYATYIVPTSSFPSVTIFYHSEAFSMFCWCLNPVEYFSLLISQFTTSFLFNYIFFGFNDTTHLRYSSYFTDICSVFISLSLIVWYLNGWVLEDVSNFLSHHSSVSLEKQKSVYIVISKRIYPTQIFF